MAFILILRHAHYYGSDDDDRISEDIGKKDAYLVYEALRKFLKDKYKNPFPKEIVFAFSSTSRAVRTATILKQSGSDLIVRGNFTTDRKDISEKDVISIFDGVMKTAEIYTAELIIIVAHGDMPPVFAETVHKIVTSKEIQLENTMTCCGYVIDTSGPGVIHSVDPRYGLFDVTYKKEEVVKPVAESKPIETSNKDISKKINTKPKAENYFDDDIPF